MTVQSLICRFCTEKLARILYDCVGCTNGDRSLLDWFTAERFVRTHAGGFEEVIAAFLSQPGAEDLEPQTYARQIPSSIDTSFEGLERVCGRAVWDMMFQPLRWELEDQFEKVHYTHIRFG